jgi:hypothetical protein
LTCSLRIKLEASSPHAQHFAGEGDYVTGSRSLGRDLCRACFARHVLPARRQQSDRHDCRRNGAGADGIDVEIHCARQTDRAFNVLCFGVNRPGDLYYVEELEELKRSLSNLEVRVSMTEADGAWSGHKGLVTELVGPNDIGEPTQICLCGPPSDDSCCPQARGRLRRATELGLLGGVLAIG